MHAKRVHHRQLCAIAAIHKQLGIASVHQHSWECVGLSEHGSTTIHVQQANLQRQGRQEVDLCHVHNQTIFASNDDLKHFYWMTQHSMHERLSRLFWLLRISCKSNNWRLNFCCNCGYFCVMTHWILATELVEHKFVRKRANIFKGKKSTDKKWWTHPNRKLQQRVTWHWLFLCFYYFVHCGTHTVIVANNLLLHTAFHVNQISSKRVSTSRVNKMYFQVKRQLYLC